jgi:PEP-CTERM motif
MKRAFLLTTAALIAIAAPGVANAAVENLAISGSLDGHGYTGTLSLDVNGGQAVSGTGTLSILGLNNAPIVLITASTPGASGYPNNLIGYRGNDGTDYFDLDQAYPISANGLLFDVGTTTAEWGLHPLFAIWSEGTGYAAAFTGNVGGAEYYNLQGSAMASATGAVPEPSTWAMGLLGFGGLGLLRWRKSRTNRLALAV